MSDEALQTAEALQAPEATPTVTITPTTDGPYEVVGEVHILAPGGTVLRETSKAYLCRCGHSANKPFCDGSHRRMVWSESAVSTP